jgi:hypothetical protein
MGGTSTCHGRVAAGYSHTMRKRPADWLRILLYAGLWAASGVLLFFWPELGQEPKMPVAYWRIGGTLFVVLGFFWVISPRLRIYMLGMRLVLREDQPYWGADAEDALEVEYGRVFEECREKARAKLGSGGDLRLLDVPPVVVRSKDRPFALLPAAAHSCEDMDREVNCVALWSKGH